MPLVALSGKLIDRGAGFYPGCWYSGSWRWRIEGPSIHGIVAIQGVVVGFLVGSDLSFFFVVDFGTGSLVLGVLCLLLRGPSVGFPELPNISIVLFGHFLATRNIRGLDPSWHFLCEVVSMVSGHLQSSEIHTLRSTNFCRCEAQLCLLH